MRFHCCLAQLPAGAGLPTRLRATMDEAHRRIYTLVRTCSDLRDDHGSDHVGWFAARLAPQAADLRRAMTALSPPPADLVDDPDNWADREPDPPYWPQLAYTDACSRCVEARAGTATAADEAELLRLFAFAVATDEDRQGLRADVCYRMLEGTALRGRIDEALSLGTAGVTGSPPAPGKHRGWKGGPRPGAGWRGRGRR